jgi:hypothetical protein
MLHIIDLIQVQIQTHQIIQEDFSRDDSIFEGRKSIVKGQR